MSTTTNAAMQAAAAGESRWVSPPVRATRLRGGLRASTAELLMKKAMAALRVVLCAVLRAGADRASSWRKHGVRLSAGLLRGGFGPSASNPVRQLAVEERLTLGPKQHLYLVRCGEQRLLVASAGEAALQWMAMPEAGDGSSQSAENGLPLPLKAKPAPRSRSKSAGRMQKQGSAR